ncbi:methionine synthase [Streptomyces sp. NP160]|uniref:methionine synthase n=1 Tax=Streptomyces sp. NP160 TaxID=2586637 RepID=UPI00111869C4|nr:methionine synthase [Streptomyces sp. NP160]TNM68471.1 methionine synthase [Streptomyces sp. NP160]
MTSSPPAPTAPRATATGAWPGEHPLEAARAVLGELGGGHLPFAPELPARGPGADPTGRTAALLVDMPVDLQPVGWRLVDHPGRDAQRAASFRTADLDALAEAADGYEGPLKLQVVGPWSLAASVWLPRGERAVVDEGAARDLLGSLVEGVLQHAADVQRLVPAAQLLVQVDEPSLPAVLEGRVPTASGWGRLRAVDAQRARDGLRDLTGALRAAGVRTALRCTAPSSPSGGSGVWPLLRTAGADALVVAAPVSRPLGSAAWEELAEALESGHELHLGVLDVPALAGGAALPEVSALLEAVRTPWDRLGLPASQLAQVVVTTTTGLAALPPAAATAALGRLRAAADALGEVLAEA